MDQKRELSSIDLAALVTELNRYRGAKVDKASIGIGARRSTRRTATTTT